MSDNKPSAESGGSGCALILLLGLAFWLLSWVFKIGLVIAGIALITTAVIGAVGVPVYVWLGVYRRSRAQAGIDAFDQAVGQLSLESAGRLRSAIAAWDAVDRKRGIGTTLEGTYFAESVDAETQHIFDRVNTLVSQGEQLLTPGHVSVDDPMARAERIDHLQAQDMTALQLEDLRRQVSR
ncbi:MAG: hypothetical protein ACTH1D_00275 [Mycobacteriaceae bacterium]|uniref:hypothetical protein n=1 Tax=Corynebacterium sp. TaxID=1720 RepID=UPI003F993273